MINNLLAFVNSENIYLIANWGVIPFWFMLIFFPNNGLSYKYNARTSRSKVFNRKCCKTQIS